MYIDWEYTYAGYGKVDQSQPPGSKSRRSCRDTETKSTSIYKMTDRDFTTFHSKTAIFDGEVSTVGSHNLDPRSFNMHSENNIVVQERDFSLESHKVFKDDLEMSKEVIKEDVEKDSKLSRIKQAFCNGLLQYF